MTEMSIVQVSIVMIYLLTITIVKEAFSDLQ